MFSLIHGFYQNGPTTNYDGVQVKIELFWKGLRVDLTVM